jgi:hypothetical protein
MSPGTRVLCEIVDASLVAGETGRVAMRTMFHGRRIVDVETTHLLRVDALG